MKKLFALLVGLLVVGATAGTAMAFPFGANKEVSRTEIEKVFNEYHRLLLKGGWLNELRAKWLLFKYGIKKGKTVTYTYSFPKMSSKSGEIQPMGGEQIYLTLEVTPYSYSSMPDYVFVDYHWEWRTPDGYPATEEWGWRGSEDLIYIPYQKGILTFDGQLIYTTLGAGSNSGVTYVREEGTPGGTYINGVYTVLTTRTYTVKDEIVEGYITIIYKIHPSAKGIAVELSMVYEHTYGNYLFSLLDDPWLNFTAGVISLGLTLIAAPGWIVYSVTAYTLSSAAESLLDGSWTASAKASWTL